MMILAQSRRQNQILSGMILAPGRTTTTALVPEALTIATRTTSKDNVENCAMQSTLYVPSRHTKLPRATTVRNQSLLYSCTVLATGSMSSRLYVLRTAETERQRLRCTSSSQAGAVSAIRGSSESRFLLHTVRL